MEEKIAAFEARPLVISSNSEWMTNPALLAQRIIQAKQEKHPELSTYLDIAIRFINSAKDEAVSTFVAAITPLAACDKTITRHVLTAFIEKLQKSMASEIPQLLTALATTLSLAKSSSPVTLLLKLHTQIRIDNVEPQELAHQIHAAQTEFLDPADLVDIVDFIIRHILRSHIKHLDPSTRCQIFTALVSILDTAQHCLVQNLDHEKQTQWEYALNKLSRDNSAYIRILVRYAKVTIHHIPTNPDEYNKQLAIVANLIKMVPDITAGTIEGDPTQAMSVTRAIFDITNTIDAKERWYPMLNAYQALIQLSIACNKLPALRSELKAFGRSRDQNVGLAFGILTALHKHIIYDDINEATRKDLISIIAILIYWRIAEKSELRHPGQNRDALCAVLNDRLCDYYDNRFKNSIAIRQHIARVQKQIVNSEVGTLVEATWNDSVPKEIIEEIAEYLVPSGRKVVSIFWSNKIQSTNKSLVSNCPVEATLPPAPTRTRSQSLPLIQSSDSASQKRDFLARHQRSASMVASQSADAIRPPVPQVSRSQSDTPPPMDGLETESARSDSSLKFST